MKRSLSILCVIALLALLMPTVALGEAWQINMKQVNCYVGDTPSLALSDTAISDVYPYPDADSVQFATDDDSVVTFLRWGNEEKTLCVLQCVGVGTCRIMMKVTRGADTYYFIYPFSVTQRPAKEPTSVTISGGRRSLSMGKSLQLVAEVQPANVSVPLTWLSSNTKVAKVDAYGKVTPVKAGSANIIVLTPNGLSASVTVKIENAAPKKITVQQGKKKTLKVGKTLQLKVGYSPDYAYSKVTWTSSNKKIATVDKNGKVKGVKKGTVTITAKTKNNKTAKIKIVVK